MAKQVQLRRGTTAALSTVTGVEGELFVDTTKDTITVHDGYQAGGRPLLREDLSNLAAGAITPTMLANGTANQLLRTNGAGSAVEWYTPDLSGRLMGVLALGPGASLSGNAVATHSDRTGSSGTWTRPAGVNSVLAYVTGGGGGSEYEDNSYRNSGGGGGGTAIKWIQNVAASVSWTVGTGGVHGQPGTDGGVSSFGSYCTGMGGQGGQDGASSQYGARGGGATGGDLNIPGGGAGFSHGSNSEQGGGMSFWTQAGSAHHPTSGTQAGSSHGRLGAGGGTGYYTQQDRNKYNGGAGIILLYYYS